jgi:NDP-sugar pyrophosphorylase family protein
MQCVILAGGLGTRMKNVGGGVPKALLPVGKSTFVDLQLQWLKLLGVSECLLALGHGGEEIESHLRKNQKDLPKLSFSYDAPKLLGTGGAIKAAQKLLEKEFLVIYGDSFVFVDLGKFHQAFENSGKPLAMTIFKNKNSGDKSNVIFNSREFLYDKKNITVEMEYIDYGLSWLKKDYFIQNTPEGQFDLSDFMTEVCQKKEAHPFVVDEIFHEIGSPDGYARFQKMMASFNYSLPNLKKARGL